MCHRSLAVARRHKMQGECIGWHHLASGPRHPQQGSAFAADAGSRVQHLAHRTQCSAQAAIAFDIGSHGTGIQYIGFFGDACTCNCRQGQCGALEIGKGE